MLEGKREKMGDEDRREGRAKGGKGEKRKRGKEEKRKGGKVEKAETAVKAVKAEARIVKRARGSKRRVTCAGESLARD